MKKFYLFSLISILFMATGCFYDGAVETERVYTTIYPIEYITNNLIGEKKEVKSIYPDGANTRTYKLTDKLKNEYAYGKTFIYNGIGAEKNIAVDLLNINKKIEIIDAMQGMNYEYSNEELWLDPSNFLMVAQNVKNGLKEYNDNLDDKKDLDEKYEEFKIDISNLDVELNLISKNSTSPVIVVSDNLFKFLEKYNIKVISLDKDNDNIDKSYAEAKRAISSGSVSYIFIKNGEKLPTEINDFVASNGIKKLKMEMIYNLTDEQRKNDETYVTLMNKNIENLKTELYD